jgi:uncharacterized protein
MHSAFTRTEHRSWHLPPQPWVWRQTWHHLLFAHWPVPVDVVGRFVPRWLDVQEHSGSTWVGLVPFTMTGVTYRRLPPVPIVSRFHEMNLRVYVERDGKPGIWFISLDAASRFAVWAARRFAHLPYFFSRMHMGIDAGTIRYSARRAGDSEVAFEGSYRPAGQPFESRPGSLEHFLTERYCLYTEDTRAGRWRMEIHHQPWPLQAATAEFQTNRVAQPQGIRLPETPPLLHYSRRLDVVGWSLERL